MPNGNGKMATNTHNGNRNGGGTLTPGDVQRLLRDGYPEGEVLSDGTVRERPSDGSPTDETVTKTFKAGRTCY